MAVGIENSEAEGLWLAVLSQLALDINQKSSGYDRGAGGWLVVNTITFGTQTQGDTLGVVTTQTAEVLRVSKAGGDRIRVAKVWGTEAGELSSVSIERDAKWSDVPAYLRKLAA